MGGTPWIDRSLFIVDSREKNLQRLSLKVFLFPGTVVQAHFNDVPNLEQPADINRYLYLYKIHTFIKLKESQL
jgi:hypothetical protein